MREWKSEMLAISKAGHDKGELFLVLDADETYFWLVDGQRRLLEKPKKKKHKHVQVIKNLPQETAELMQSITLDAHVRKILKTYHRGYS